MQTHIQHLFLYVTLGCLFAAGGTVIAQQNNAAPQTPAVEQSTADTAAAEQPAEQGSERPAADENGDATRAHITFDSDSADNVIVRIGSNSYLPADGTANAVVSVIGSSTTEGRVHDAVVSIFGNSTVTGPIGDAVVSVFGDTYINSKVNGEAVAVFGDVVLGPNAEVGAGAVSVGGSVVRDPAAVVHGGVQEVYIPGDLVDFGWLRPWLKECLLLGRPLALAPGLGWAWSLALGALGLYVLIGLLFPKAVETCVETLQTRPGQSILAALLTLLLSPVLVILLMITVIGIAVIPFVGIAFFLVGLFGKAVILAAIGRRLTHSLAAPLNHIGLAVLIGGSIVLALYLVPVVGFIVYKLTWLLGLGVVVYTLLLAWRPRRENGTFAPAPAAAPHLNSDAGVSASGFAPTPGTTMGFAEPVFDSTSSTSAPEVEPMFADTTSQPGPTPPPAAAAAPPPQKAPVDLTTLPRATFGVRMGALLIDVILVGFVLNVFTDLDNITLLTLATYAAVMWKLKSTTVGGIVFNLQVARLDGREIDWPTAIVRALGCFLSLAVVFLGFIWIAIDQDRQAWHDKIAGTIVVRVPKGTPLV